MKTVRVGNGHTYEVPETWAEGEEMITKSMAYHDTRGTNLAQLSTATRVAYGMYGHQFMASDPTQALMYLMQRLCQRNRERLERSERK